MLDNDFYYTVTTSGTSETEFGETILTPARLLGLGEAENIQFSIAGASISGSGSCRIRGYAAASGTGTEEVVFDTGAVTLTAGTGYTFSGKLSNQVKQGTTSTYLRWTYLQTGTTVCTIKGGLVVNRQTAMV